MSQRRRSLCAQARAIVRILRGELRRLNYLGQASAPTAHRAAVTQIKQHLANSYGKLPNRCC